MFAITLEWVQGQVLQSQTINTAQSTLSPGVVCLGPDDQQCDIVVADPEGTVSRLHVEIYQDPHSQVTFFGLIRKPISRALPFNPLYFWVIGYVAVLGLAWDALYTYLQRFFWDRNWPGVVAMVGALFEGGLLLLLIKTIALPMIPRDLDWIWFWVHYSFVSIAAYLFSWGGLRILFPRARYRGGAWLGVWPRPQSASR